MDAFITILKRILSTFRKDRCLEELQEEMDFHIATRAEKYSAAGMSRADALKEARKEFGSSVRLREQGWHQWAFTWMDELVQDIRYAIRVLLQNKVWTAVAVLSLALGIGANTAIFSVFDALLLKSLPVKDPEQLLALRGPFHYSFFQAVREDDIFAEVFASSGVSEQAVEIDNAPPEKTMSRICSWHAQPRESGRSDFGSHWASLGCGSYDNC